MSLNEWTRLGVDTAPWSDEALAVALEDRARREGVAHTEPDLWHGLVGLDDEVERWTRRLTSYHAAHGFGAGRPMLPSYSADTLKADAHGQTPDARDLRRLPLLLSDLADAHPEHWYWSAPFCGRCHGDLLATARLRRWLIANPGKSPRETVPDVIPGDVVEVEAQERRDPFVSLDDLLALPEPEMLIDELVPEGAYGLITGRDGTGKSFLALDLCMHLVTAQSTWYGQRSCGLVNYGRALYVVGEGVRSFGRRVQGWLAEHDAVAPSGDDLVFRNGTVDLYAGGAEWVALLAKVEAMRPDLIVIDTLARSSGAGEQNSAADMAQVLRRIDALKVAADGGTVLLVAHTDKGDNDARGSSAIEDDADFVLHVTAKDSTQHVKVAKQKDGPSGQTVALTMAQVRIGEAALDPMAEDERPTTLVLREAGKDGAPLVSPEDSTKDRILGVLLEQRSLDPKTQADLVTTLKELGREVTRQAVSKALGILVEEGSVVKAPLRGATRYSIAAHRIPKDMR